MIKICFVVSFIFSWKFQLTNALCVSGFPFIPANIDETKIHANAPVTKVKISNISKQKKNTTNKKKKSFSIVIGDFYSKETALFLKERLIKDLDNIDEKKLKIRIINKKSVKLLSGPYNSIEMLKNDYISLNNFGFEDLDIKLND